MGKPKSAKGAKNRAAGGGRGSGPPNNSYTREELAAALVFYAGKLDETVDAVFLAAADDSFLTLDYCSKLIEVQGLAQLAAERISQQLIEGLLS